jgi:hypothetical protein
MPVLAPFLQKLLYEGEAVLTERPTPAAGPDLAATECLREAFADYRQQVAGPLIDYDGGAALAAGRLVQWACWYLVNRAAPEAELEGHLAMPRAPASAAQHLSADLVLRYLPQVYRRARALVPADRLTALLACVLRQWPLTGVLADVEEEPAGPLEFGGHPGLMLLYAERLAGNEKPAWFPAGQAADFVELVFAGMGKERAAALHRRRLAAAREGGGDVRR